jgi:cytochrome c553
MKLNIAKFKYGKAGTLFAALLLGYGMAGAAQAEDAKTIATNVCAACHGADGNSVVPIFPKLAGLQKDYIIKQLKDFQSGKRKNDVMSPVALQQMKAEDIEPLADYFSQQQRTRGESSSRMVASAGKVLFNEGNDETGVPACVGCHQPKGVGAAGSNTTQPYTYPKIGNQHADYIKQQLKNFKAGDRTNDPSRFMRTTASRMTEEEMDEVAQYLTGVGE